MAWILLDTETTGLKPPIFVVELAAQRMRGWEPEGPPFRRLLNQNRDIPPEAARVHGYTREILERDGDTPQQVYAEFAAYAADLPLVAYNLSYDLDQVLLPEWQRLGITPIGTPGFCALRLAQRLLDPVPAGNCKLQTLRQYYRLPERGAHTGLGDVETVVDLLQQVLKPLAHQRGIKTFQQLQAFASETWYPSRIAFGKHKGRHFTEARQDTELYRWLEWLAGSSNPRSAEMGRWYLRQLEQAADEDLAAVLVEPTSSELVIYSNPELAALRRLIAEARTRLAELETEFTRERHAVDQVQARLFEMLRPEYQQRDQMRLVIRYRRRYLDSLMQEGEEAAAKTADAYQEARQETDREYEQAAEDSQRKARELSEEDQRSLKKLWSKLVRLYHPDRFTDDPEKQAIYQRLTAEINQARNRGDLKRLREIADDPNGFLLRMGLDGLDFADDDQLPKLRQLYESLQGQILALLDNLESLRESADYELYLSSTKDPDWLANSARQHAEALKTQISELEQEAKQLAEEIEGLVGVAAPL
jgi:DNA polymerase-3 subunit epsilon